MADCATITTSWDDGHPLDFKIAELLDKYKLPGTFYIPKNNAENKVMDEGSIQALAKRFEIGGHTLNHLTAEEIDLKTWKVEVEACYNWLSNITGEYPTSFCFPKGKFNKGAADVVFKTGFKLARTTELMNLTTGADRIIPTTIQVYEHSKVTYVKHLLKRRRFKNLFLWMQGNCQTDIERLADKYLEESIAKKGCLHIWGHSWEIENKGLWQKMENVFKKISGIPEIKYVSNQDLIQCS